MMESFKCFPTDSRNLEILGNWVFLFKSLDLCFLKCLHGKLNNDYDASLTYFGIWYTISRLKIPNENKKNQISNTFEIY